MSVCAEPPICICTIPPFCKRTGNGKFPSQLPTAFPVSFGHRRSIQRDSCNKLDTFRATRLSQILGLSNDMGCGESVAVLAHEKTCSRYSRTIGHRRIDPV